MEIKRHIKKYGNWTDERSEIASGDLKKPYVAYIEEDNVIDWDTQSAAKDYSKEYFTIVVNEPGQLDVTAFAGREMEYSVNGTDWVAFDAAALNLPITGDIFPRKIHFRGVNTTLGGSSAFTRFMYSDGGNTKPFNAEGNIMSLLYGEDFANKTSFPEGSTYAFTRLFSNSGIVSANNLILPATTLGLSCYRNMFQSCTSLTAAPELPATTLVNSCYRNMFQSCTSLTAAPELPATTFASNCCERMFYGCTALNWVKSLADLPTSYAFTYWLYNVSPTGTFVKKAGVTWPTGNSGIPNGWTVEEV